MIRALAKSLGGSEHILTGKVVDKQSVPWADEKEAREHLAKIGWTEVRLEVDRHEEAGVVRTVWDDQSVTEHIPGTGAFTYIVRQNAPTEGAAGVSKKQIKKDRKELPKKTIAADGTRPTLTDLTPKLDQVRVHDVLIDKDPV